MQSEITGMLAIGNGEKCPYCDTVITEGIDIFKHLITNHENKVLETLFSDLDNDDVKVTAPTNFDHIQSLNFIWEKLHYYREDCIPESNPDYDEEWSDICISMAWIEDKCGVKRVEGILEDK